MDIKDLYMKEDYQKIYNKRKIYLLHLPFLLFIIIIYFVFFDYVQSYWWVPLISLLVLVSFINAISELNYELERMTSLDAFYRTFGEVFDKITIKGYQRIDDKVVLEDDIEEETENQESGKKKKKKKKQIPKREGKFEPWKYIYKGNRELNESDFEEEIITAKREAFSRPIFRMEGEHKGLNFFFTEYEKWDYYTLDKKWLKEPKPTIKYLLKVKLPAGFSGSVYISSKLNQNVVKNLKGDRVQTESIEFNEEFTTISTTDLGAFRLLTPKNMLRIMKVHGEYKKKNKKYRDFTLLFREGNLYTNQTVPKRMKQKWGSKKLQKLDKVKKECDGAIRFIKFYIDSLELDRERYTTGE